MRTVTQAMANWLAAVGNSNALRADLWKITILGQSPLYWTGADQDITYDGHVYVSGPVVERGQMELSAKLKADSLTLTLAGLYVLASGRTIAATALSGVFDAAVVELRHLVMPTWGDLSLGHIPLFDGAVVGRGVITATEVELELISALGQLTGPFPKRIYAPHCPYTLYDAACGLTLAEPSLSVRAWGTNLDWVEVAPLSTYAANYFTLGSVLFTSGVLSGVRRTVVSSADAGGGHRCYVMPRLPQAPATNDSMTGRRGCDKLYSTCNGTFSNSGRFGGFRHVPPPEIAG